MVPVSLPFTVLTVSYCGMPELQSVLQYPFMEIEIRMGILYKKL